MGVTVNGLVVGATVVTLSRYYRQFVIQGPGAFVEEADDYADFERTMQRKLLRELGVFEISAGVAAGQCLRNLSRLTTSAAPGSAAAAAAARRGGGAGLAGGGLLGPPRT